MDSSLHVVAVNGAYETIVCGYTLEELRSMTCLDLTNDDDRIDTIPAAAMEVFARYPWPGNVREMRHFMERSVVLTSGNIPQAPLRESEQVIRNQVETATHPAESRTMEQIERESILQALREFNWMVGGPTGASVRLRA
jgi:formate hydrogenlyase transcriptional activator